MSDDLSLAPSVVDAQLERSSVEPPSDPWLARRMLGFGASEIAALFVGLDVRDPATLGSKARKHGHRFERGRFREPRILLEKARIVAPLAEREKSDGPSARGKRLEREIVERWRRLVAA